MKPGRHICTSAITFMKSLTNGKARVRNMQAFEELSPDWKCPSCGAAKEMYQPCSCVTVGPAHIHEHPGQAAGA